MKNRTTRNVMTTHTHHLHTCHRHCIVRDRSINAKIRIPHNTRHRIARTDILPRANNTRINLVRCTLYTAERPPVEHVRRQQEQRRGRRTLSGVSSSSLVLFYCYYYYKTRVKLSREHARTALGEHNARKKKCIIIYSSNFL